MPTTYTLTEARRHLAAIVKELDHHDQIELTQDGQPVAVLLSPRAYQRLTAPKLNFWEAYQAWRQSINPADLEGPDPFVDVRDRSPGRDVNLFD